MDGCSFLFNLFIMGFFSDITGGSLVGGAMSMISQALGAKRQYKYQSKLAEQQFDYQQQLQNQQNDFNLDMWNRTNEYNSASAQVQRAEDAGLNPGMLMSGQSAGAAQQLTSANPTFSMPNGNGIGALPDIGAFFLEAAKTEAQVKLADSEMKLNEVNAGKSQSEKEGIDIVNMWIPYEKDANLQLVRKNFDKAAKEIELDDQNIKKLEREVYWMDELNKPQLDSLVETVNLYKEKIKTEIANQLGIKASEAQSYADAYMAKMLGDKAAADKLLAEANKDKTEAEKVNVEKLGTGIDIDNDVKSFERDLKHKGVYPGSGGVVGFFATMLGASARRLEDSDRADRAHKKNEHNEFLSAMKKLTHQAMKSVGHSEKKARSVAAKAWKNPNMFQPKK